MMLRWLIYIILVLGLSTYFSPLSYGEETIQTQKIELITYSIEIKREIIARNSQNWEQNISSIDAHIIKNKNNVDDLENIRALASEKSDYYLKNGPRNTYLLYEYLEVKAELFILNTSPIVPVILKEAITQTANHSTWSQKVFSIAPEFVSFVQNSDNNTNSDNSWHVIQWIAQTNNTWFTSQDAGEGYILFNKLDEKYQSVDDWQFSYDAHGDDLSVYEVSDWKYRLITNHPENKWFSVYEVQENPRIKRLINHFDVLNNSKNTTITLNQEKTRLAMRIRVDSNTDEIKIFNLSDIEKNQEDPSKIKEITSFTLERWNDTWWFQGIEYVWEYLYFLTGTSSLETSKYLYVYTDDWKKITRKSIQLNKNIFRSEWTKYEPEWLEYVDGDLFFTIMTWETWNNIKRLYKVSHRSLIALEYEKCSFDNESISHGRSKVFYSKKNVKYWETCENYSKKLTCNNGLFREEDTYKYTSCSVALSQVLNPNFVGFINNSDKNTQSDNSWNNIQWIAHDWNTWFTSQDAGNGYILFNQLDTNYDSVNDWQVSIDSRWDDLSVKKISNWKYYMYTNNPDHDGFSIYEVQDSPRSKKLLKEYKLFEASQSSTVTLNTAKDRIAIRTYKNSSTDTITIWALSAIIDSKFSSQNISPITTFTINKWSTQQWFQWIEYTKDYVYILTGNDSLDSKKFIYIYNLQTKKLTKKEISVDTTILKKEGNKFSVAWLEYVDEMLYFTVISWEDAKNIKRLYKVSAKEL